MPPKHSELNTTVLDDVARFARRFVVLTEIQADLVALWAAHTHAITAFDCTPYLSIKSPEKRSGKTRLLEVLELLVRVALPTANTSDAALFRSVAQLTPTLLLDEVDAIFKAREREDLRGLLNAGYRRGAKVRRMGGPRNTTLEEFEVFCAKAFAGIGNCLPDTILDRSITVALQQKRRDEVVERFRRRRVAPEGDELHARLADWVEPHLDWLHAADPDLPDELDDRAQDIWEPLLAIADLAGGGWPARARQAALVLSSGEEREDESVTALLIVDIHSVFVDTGVHRLRTGALIAGLAEIEESPWGDWRGGGKPITAQALSGLLKTYRIKTLPVWSSGKTVRGYKLEQFADAISRVGGVRTVRTVSSGSSSPAAPNAPNAPNASPAAERATSIPHAGDDSYLEFVATRFTAGHLTTGEALELELLHKRRKTYVVA